MSHSITSTFVSVHAAPDAETSTDLGALDQRVNAALRLFEKSDPMAGEAELKDMAERYPSYAPAHFYLGLVSQKRGDPETAIGFYAAAFRAGGLLFVAYDEGDGVLSKLHRDCPVLDLPGTFYCHMF